MATPLLVLDFQRHVGLVGYRLKTLESDESLGLFLRRGNGFEVFPFARAGGGRSKDVY